MPNQRKNPAIRKRRTQIKIFLTDEERQIIEEKMEKYGYKSLAAYVRDACIYENIIVEDIKDKKEISEKIATLISEFKKTRNDVNSLVYNPAATSIDIKIITNTLKNIEKNILDLKVTVIEKLEVVFDRKKVNEFIEQKKEGDS